MGKMIKHCDAVAFDCDGTLSELEGITALAKMNSCEQVVRELTEKAMSGGGLNEPLFAERLNITRPTQNQLMQLGQLYYQHRTKHIHEVITELQQLGKAVFILSAGYTPAVVDFAKRLGVPAEHVHAVGLRFDEQGNYKDFDHQSPLIHNQGKAEIIQNIQKQYNKIVYMGDGANDLAVIPYVKCFVGFGAHFPRELMKEKSDYYMTKNDARALLDV